MWIQRHLKTKLLNAVKTRPAVFLTGARQTGKTSLLQREFPGSDYVTFDYLRQVEAVKESPEYFLGQFKEQVILDEIQYVPEVFRELKVLIDQDRDTCGKWIMTGSQQFSLMEHISESLAGRVGILHLETLSASELRNTDVDTIKDFLWKGGYPELWAKPGIDVKDYFESYLRTYVERDLKAIIDVRNLSDFRRFIRIAATRCGQLINYRSLSSDVGVSDVTIKKWIHAMELSGLIYLLPPFYANIGKRFVKSPKLYFADHGLLCYISGVNGSESWHAHPGKGGLWENLVMMELVKNFSLVPGRDLFFYRDHNGVEIDFIIEKPGRLTLIEAKAGERVALKKLNFSKVAPLLSETSRIDTLLALTINESRILPGKGFRCYNPLMVSPPLE